MHKHKLCFVKMLFTINLYKWVPSDLVAMNMVSMIIGLTFCFLLPFGSHFNLNLMWAYGLTLSVLGLLGCVSILTQHLFFFSDYLFLSSLCLSCILNKFSYWRNHFDATVPSVCILSVVSSLLHFTSS